VATAGFWGEVGDQAPEWGRTILDNASSKTTTSKPSAAKNGSTTSRFWRGTPIRAYGAGPQAFRSNGEGSFEPDKNYYSTQMQAVTFTVVDAETSRGEDGSFGGCPAPVNCWIPVTGDWTIVNE
jgi:hypothetical protein